MAARHCRGETMNLLIFRDGYCVGKRLYLLHVLGNSGEWQRSRRKRWLPGALRIELLGSRTSQHNQVFHLSEVSELIELVVERIEHLFRWQVQLIA